MLLRNRFGFLNRRERRERREREVSFSKCVSFEWSIIDGIVRCRTLQVYSLVRGGGLRFCSSGFNRRVLSAELCDYMNPCSAKNSGVIVPKLLMAGISSQDSGCICRPLRRNFATYLPSISASKLTKLPGCK